MFWLVLPFLIVVAAGCAAMVWSVCMWFDE
jgi:hypothetical protein